MNDGTRWLASSSHQSDNKRELIIRTNYILVLEKFTRIHEFKLVTIELVGLSQIEVRYT